MTSEGCPVLSKPNRIFGHEKPQANRPRAEPAVSDERHESTPPD